MEGLGCDDDDDDIIEVIDHEGYTYEKTCTSTSTLWTCKEAGCGGQLSVKPVRSKRWRHRHVNVYRDSFCGSLIARKIYRTHNHPAAAAAALKRKQPWDSKELKSTGKKCNKYETKSSCTQTMNIDSIKDNGILKNLDILKNTIAYDTKMPTSINENKNAHENKVLDHIVEENVIVDKNSKVTDLNENVNRSGVNVVDVHKKEDTSSFNNHCIIEIPSILNKIRSCTVNNSNSKENIDKNIAVCDAYVLKSTDENKDCFTKDSFTELTEPSNLQKTEHLKPLQLFRCKLCNIYVVLTNYQQHTETIAHTIAKLYSKSKNVQVIKGHCENVFLSTRIVSTCNSDSIHDFFNSIEKYICDLIGCFIRLKNSHIKLNLKMFALYQKTSQQNSDILGNVTTFDIKDEILTKNTVLRSWFNKVSSTFKLNNQNYLNVVCQVSHRLVRVMFLEIYFFEL